MRYPFFSSSRKICTGCGEVGGGGGGQGQL